MQRLLSDHDVQGHVSRLMDICQLPPWVDLWRELDCIICTFEDFDLPLDATDAAIWQVCQDHNVLLITGNRNAESPESLEMTIHQMTRLNILTLRDLCTKSAIKLNPGSMARRPPAAYRSS